MPLVKSEISKENIRQLLGFSIKHTAAETALAFPMVGEDTICHLYALTAEEREHLFMYVLFPPTHRRRIVGKPTPVRGCDADTSGASSSWDIIVKLYEDA